MFKEATTESANLCVDVVHCTRLDAAMLIASRCTMSSIKALELFNYRRMVGEWWANARANGEAEDRKVCNLITRLTTG